MTRQGQVMRSTGFSRSIGAAILLSAASALAHDSLYNYIEVRPVDGESVRIEFTVHAAELVPGIDPNSADLLWLETLTDSQVETLIDDAKAFVSQSYHCLLPSGAKVAFANCEAIRRLARDPEAPRPGCIIGSVVVSTTAIPLSIRYDESAQKRLMLVTSKPGAFPRVTDIAPGEQFEISTP